MHSYADTRCWFWLSLDEGMKASPNEVHLFSCVPLWIRSSHFMIYHDMSWYIMINDMFCHEMSPNIIICHEMSPCSWNDQFHFECSPYEFTHELSQIFVKDGRNWQIITTIVHELSWKIAFFMVFPSTCHEMSFNLTCDIWWHVMTYHEVVNLIQRGLRHIAAVQYPTMCCFHEYKRTTIIQSWRRQVYLLQVPHLLIRPVMKSSS